MIIAIICNKIANASWEFTTHQELYKELYKLHGQYVI